MERNALNKKNFKSKVSDIKKRGTKIWKKKLEWISLVSLFTQFWKNYKGYKVKLFHIDFWKIMVIESIKIDDLNYLRYLFEEKFYKMRIMFLAIGTKTLNSSVIFFFHQSWYINGGKKTQITI